MSKEEESKKGLQCLDDWTLAKIVESEVEEQGEVKFQPAISALHELARRTPEQ